MFLKANSTRKKPKRMKSLTPVPRFRLELLQCGMKGELSTRNKHLLYSCMSALLGWAGDFPQGKHLVFLKRPAAKCDCPPLSCRCANEA